ncbi:MAG: ATP-binding protein [Selenomonadaceae bacterium]|nr:ATP-binding protein [Selenomonadaceae bacterium]
MNETLNSQYTLENFVKTKYNQMTYAAARGVARSPGRLHNPLFIYGDAKQEKTHLLHAIGNEILKNFPDQKILYVTAETFVNELIRSVRDNTMEEFRRKYREVDALLFEDIQFLAGKPGNQEEFYNTCLSIFNAQSVLVVSSDCHPDNLPDFSAELRLLLTVGITTQCLSPK